MSFFSRFFGRLFSFMLKVKGFFVIGWGGKEVRFRLGIEGVYLFIYLLVLFLVVDLFYSLGYSIVLGRGELAFFLL